MRLPAPAKFCEIHRSFTNFYLESRRQGKVSEIAGEKCLSRIPPLNKTAEFQPETKRV